MTSAPGGADADPARPGGRPARRWRRCSRLGRAGEVSDPAGLGLARLLLGGNGPEELEEFVAPRSGRSSTTTRTGTPGWPRPSRRGSTPGEPLRETAERLHIHPNTVTQRLERVGQLLGASWREPTRKLDVQLALQMAGCGVRRSATPTTGGETHTPAIGRASYHRGVRVLIVEDELFLAEAIQAGLRLEAIAADVVGDGDSALERLVGEQLRRRRARPRPARHAR